MIISRFQKENCLRLCQYGYTYKGILCFFKIAVMFYIKNKLFTFICVGGGGVNPHYFVEYDTYYVCGEVFFCNNVEFVSSIFVFYSSLGNPSSLRSFKTSVFSSETSYIALINAS